MLKDKLQADLKAAMLARDTDTVETLKGLKSAILYAEVETNKRDTGLGDDEILVVLKKEAKKRQDAIDLYIQGGNQKMADKEQTEKDLIETYLPAALGENEVNQIIDSVLSELSVETLSAQDMGRVIGAVKQKAGPSADGATIARLVKARL